ncbi:MAG: hypothetical protein TR69_WS6001000621 [candidate division WS6 bacterium OLB20]|uniref:Uncharacterized protein n=1 Tax=candidate division WS6 bacterium OLB20 TaxID=1617426 RepID=A0A136LY70_9BACT|nr:MAG: hypothetical protein TR69_WS6001000621 [candidate division WS6 bacterium OLB20]
MHAKKTALKLFVFAAGALFFIASVLLIGFLKDPSGTILGTVWCNGVSPCDNAGEPAVTVSGFIRISQINFTVYPEKREPAVNNWDTIAGVVIENCTTLNQFTYNNIATDTAGYGTINVPIANPVPDGDYRFFIRGYSHLNEEFNCYTLDTVSPDIDLYLEGKELLAGETSNTYDNYINSLDMSVLIGDLFTGSYLSDLNQDSEVNGLDFGNQIYNLFVSGD